MPELLQRLAKEKHGTWKLYPKSQRDYTNLSKLNLSGVIRANRKFECFGRIGLTRYKNRGVNCE